MVWSALTFWYVVPVVLLALVGVVAWVMVRFNPWTSRDEPSDAEGIELLGDYR